MKFKLLITSLVIMLSASLQAQVDFGFGLQKDLFGISLNAENAENATFNLDNVNVSMLINEHLQIGLGIQSGTIVNHETKCYDPSAGLSLNAAYLFNFRDYKDFAIAPTVSIGNSFKDFMSFKNIDVDLGVRTYLFKSGFIGTGIRYAQWDVSKIVNGNNCLTWYWEMGFNLYFRKPSKK